MKIISAISGNSSITTAELATLLGATRRTVQRYIDDLRAAGILKREGSDKSGKWIIK